LAYFSAPLLLLIFSDARIIYGFERTSGNGEILEGITLL